MYVMLLVSINSNSNNSVTILELPKWVLGICNGWMGMPPPAQTKLNTA